jgi:outer membrane protein OmpA-like peptidoglycan-associated protein
MDNLQGPRQYKVNVCFDDISIQEISGKTAQVKDLLTQMEAVTGNTFVLKQVYFDTDSYVLLENSFAELDQLIVWLQQHPATTIQVNGHTDNTGNAAHNQQLSKNRAKAVMDYLVNKGIDTKRVLYKGYGAQYPLADNTTEMGKALNRRVEFTVL